jgi:3-oxoacyl-[acyl-carrier protein] reductase
MDLGLKGQCAVVTGASKGIGRAIALRLAQEGVDVAICARGEPALRAVEHEMGAWGTKVWASPCDVAARDSLDRFLESAHDALGRVDILVNNASAFGFADDETGWHDSLAVDLMAAVRATWKVAPWMSADGGGSIVHIASVSGMEAGSPPAYAAAKAALVSHSKTLAVALAPRKIRVNVVAPGSIEFPGGMWAAVKATNRPLYEAVLATIPSGRMGTPEEVGDAVAFLVSSKASWITGACLAVDGAQHKGNL